MREARRVEVGGGSSGRNESCAAQGQKRIQPEGTSDGGYSQGVQAGQSSMANGQRQRKETGTDQISNKEKRRKGGHGEQG